MKYISIDIETTGLDKITNQVLEIGAIIEDSKDPKPFDELPKFRRIIYHPFLQGNPFALNMNSNLLELMAKRQSAKDKEKFDVENNMCADEKTAVLDFADWVHCNYTAPFVGDKPPYLIIPAGKNFASFDRPFLEELPEWSKHIKFFHRTLDPVTCFIDWKKDTKPPDLTKCKERCGLEKEVTHNALEDAWDVIQVLRKKY